jgi:hypothetical protein
VLLLMTVMMIITMLPVTLLLRQHLMNFLRIAFHSRIRPQGS